VVSMIEFKQVTIYPCSDLELRVRTNRHYLKLALYRAIEIVKIATIFLPTVNKKINFV